MSIDRAEKEVAPLLREALAAVDERERLLARCAAEEARANLAEARCQSAIDRLDAVQARCTCTPPAEAAVVRERPTTKSVPDERWKCPRCGSVFETARLRELLWARGDRYTEVIQCVCGEER